MTTDWHAIDRKEYEQSRLAQEQLLVSDRDYQAWINHPYCQVSSNECRRLCAENPEEGKKYELLSTLGRAAYIRICKHKPISQQLFERLFPDCEYTGHPRDEARVYGYIASKLNLRPDEIEELALPDLYGFVDAIAPEAKSNSSSPHITTNTLADQQASSTTSITSRIALDYRKLAERFEDYGKRSNDPHHIAVNVTASHVQAGRLLYEAIEAGAFPIERREINRGWWNAERHPAGPLVGKTITNADDDQCALGWVMAIGSWLAKQFPSRFRQNAAEWFWNHVATDDDGKLIGKDRKPLKTQWYHHDEPLPDDFSFQDIPVGGEGYRKELIGEPAHTSDFYNDDDWLENNRIQAEVNAAACTVLAELLENIPSANDSRVTRAGKAFWAASSDEDKQKWEVRKKIGLAVLDALTKQGFFEQAEADSRAAKAKWESTFGESYPETIPDLIRLAARAGVSGERLLNGDWTPADVEPIIEGYLQALQDQPPIENRTANTVSSSSPSLNEVAQRILYAIATQKGERLGQVAWAAAASVSRSTLQKYLPQLIEAGLVDAPKEGTRQGYAATDAGRSKFGH